jgi:prepilin-type N-terminal cleavage/methylation domain-containing protein
MNPLSYGSQLVPRRGFTLIELLVVISVIVVLMGLLIPAIGIARAQARKAKARTQIMQIQAALKQFKDVNGMYPEMDYSVDPPVAMSANGQANTAALLKALKTVNREDFRDSTLLDPFRNPIYYRPAKVYLYDPAKPKGTIDSDDPPGADSYQVWSIGPNSRDEVSTATDPANLGDDIVSWR